MLFTIDLKTTKEIHNIGKYKFCDPYVCLINHNIILVGRKPN